MVVLKNMCNTPVLTPFELNVSDVYIVSNHGVELKAKAPPSIQCFMFRRLKIVADSILCQLTHYNFGHHVNMQLIKNPQPAMSMQQIMRRGHDFLRIRWGWIFKPWGPMGKIQMSKGEPIKTVNYLYCLIHPIIYYCQNLVELVIAWDGQGMIGQIQIGEGISFWETCFDSLGK